MWDQHESRTSCVIPRHSNTHTNAQETRAIKLKIQQQSYKTCSAWVAGSTQVFLIRVFKYRLYVICEWCALHDLNYRALVCFAHAVRVRYFFYFFIFITFYIIFVQGVIVSKWQNKKIFCFCLETYSIIILVLRHSKKQLLW